MARGAALLAGLVWGRVGLAEAAPLLLAANGERFICAGCSQVIVLIRVHRCGFVVLCCLLVGNLHPFYASE